MNLNKAILISFLVHVVFLSIITFNGFQRKSEKEVVRVFKLINVLEDTTVKKQEKVNAEIEKKILEDKVASRNVEKKEEDIAKLKKEGEDKAPVPKLEAQAIVKTEKTLTEKAVVKKPEAEKPLPVAEKNDPFEALAKKQAERLKSVIDMDAKVRAHKLARNIDPQVKKQKIHSKIKEFFPSTSAIVDSSFVIKEKTFTVDINKKTAISPDLFENDDFFAIAQKNDALVEENREIDLTEETKKKSATVDFKALSLDKKEESVLFQAKALNRGIENIGKKGIESLDPLFTEFLEDDKNHLVQEASKQFEGVELSFENDNLAYTTPSLVRYNPPQYSKKAQESGVSGRVVLKLVVLKTGEVEDVSVIHENVGEELTRNAKISALQSRLAPVYYEGKPVKAEIRMTVRFTLSNS